MNGKHELPAEIETDLRRYLETQAQEQQLKEEKKRAKRFVSVGRARTAEAPEYGDDR